MSTPNDLYTITEAAKMTRVTRQAIYAAIKIGKLPVVRTGYRIHIYKNEFASYIKRKYDHSLRKKKNGDLIFDKSKGLYSLNEASKYLKIKRQKLYYDARSNNISFSKFGVTYIFKKEDLDVYKKTLRR